MTRDEGPEGLVIADLGQVAGHAADTAGLKPGDEVILPAYTFEASAAPVLRLEAVPVFVDVDAATFLDDGDRVLGGPSPNAGSNQTLQPVSDSKGEAGGDRSNQ